MSPSIAIRFYIGLNDKDGEPIPFATMDVHRTLDGVYDGYTLTDAVGTWDGCSEPSIVADILRPDIPENWKIAEDVARTLARRLNQECVALTIQRVGVFKLIGPSIQHGVPVRDRTALEADDLGGEPIRSTPLRERTD